MSCSVLMRPAGHRADRPRRPPRRLGLIGWAKANADVGAPPRFPGDHKPSVSISMQTQATLAGKLLGAARRQGQARLGRPSEIPAEGRRPPRGRPSTADGGPASGGPAAVDGGIARTAVGLGPRCLSSK